MRKLLLIMLVAVIVLLGGGVLWVYLKGEETLRAAVERHGPEVLGAPVSLAGVSFAPFSGQAGFDGLAIGNPEGFTEAEALRLGAFSIKLEPMSLFSDVIEIPEIAISSPRIRIEPGRGGTNLQALQRNVAAFAGPQEEAETAPTPVRIADLRVTGAQVVVGAGPIGFSDQTLSLPDIHLENLGGADGIAPSEVVKRVFDALMPQVQSVLTSQAGQRLLNQARERLGNLEGEAREAVEGAVGDARQQLQDQGGNLQQKLQDQGGNLQQKLQEQGGEASKKAEETLKKGLGGLLGQDEKAKDDGTEDAASDDSGGGN